VPNAPPFRLGPTVRAGDTPTLSCSVKSPCERSTLPEEWCRSAADASNTGSGKPPHSDDAIELGPDHLGIWFDNRSPAPP
jgi:hypothetical protein